MTQGMVCHETYRTESGEWVSPQDIFFHGDGSCTRKDDGVPIIQGRSEKMSKSKKNLVDLTGILRDYGVDASRLFVISDTPPDRDQEWTDTGIQGCVKFLNRIWRLTQGLMPSSTLSDAQKKALYKRAHIFIRDVTQDLETFALNKYSARLREYLNDLGFFGALSYTTSEERYALESLVIALNPVCPHMAEEVWHCLGHDSMLTDVSWPIYDPQLVMDLEETYAIQVNGRLRKTIQVSKGLSQDDLKELVLQEEALKPFVEGKDIKKWIIVPGKVVNLVVA
jgi:leucyl-tRNA synthetase